MNEPAPYPAKSCYDAPKAEHYDHRPERRHKPEMALLEPALRLIPQGSKVLDAPCGAGRVSVRLAELGMKVAPVDISDAMLELTREKMRPFGFEACVRHADLEKLDVADREFDAAVCFRFFHHLPSQQLRQTVIGELCRAACRFVIISFFHPVSPHSVHSYLNEKLLGKPRRRFTIWPAELNRMFGQHGFHLIRLTAQSKYLRTLWLAVYERN